MICDILERSRTALWRLIDATAKSSSSLNTYPIPDFLGPAAMQRETFSRARKILGIRILPRAPTLQTYLFWPIGVNKRRELAQYSSDSRFFWSSCNATRNIFTCAKKKLDPIWLPNKSVCSKRKFSASKIQSKQESKSDLGGGWKPGDR